MIQKSQILILPEHFDKILLSIFCVTYNDLGDKLLGEFRGNFGHIWTTNCWKLFPSAQIEPGPLGKEPAAGSGDWVIEKLEEVDKLESIS